MAETGVMDQSWPRRQPEDGRTSEVEGSPTTRALIDQVLGVLARQVGLRLWVASLQGGETAAFQMVDGQLVAVDEPVRSWAVRLALAAVAGGGSTVVPDAAEDPELAHLVEQDDFEVGAVVAAPIADPASGPPVVLCGIDPEPCDESLASAAELVESFAALLGMVWVLQRASDEAQLEVIEVRERGQRDALTGLLNRAGWDAAIEREAERCRVLGQAGSIVIVDLDNLKELNDRFGHSHGDERLQALAGAIAETARVDDVVARLGGDEFGLLAPGSAPGTGESLARRLSERFADHGLAASIGTAECPPGGDLLETWRRADLEMYASKRFKRGSDDTRSGVADLGELADAACTLVSAPLRMLRSLRPVSKPPGPTGR